MGLKDYFESDMQTFINQDDFAEIHTIDGRQLSIVVDNEQLQERSKKEYDGIMVGEILYFVSVSAYGPEPEIESVQIYDLRPMKVFDVRTNAGMYEIILKSNRM